MLWPRDAFERETNKHRDNYDSRSDPDPQLLTLSIFTADYLP